MSLWLALLAAPGLIQSGRVSAENHATEPASAAVAGRADRCQCLWQGSFAEVAPNADLVIQGQVSRLRGNAADVAVENTLLGPDYRDQVRVWLQSKDYCRPEPELFPEGSRWILALERIREVPPDGFDPSTPNISYGRVDDFSLSSCGGFYLAMHGDTVTGNLIPGAPRWNHTPKMSPVLTGWIAKYLAGSATVADLVSASEVDPALQQLKLDTRSFLRGQEQWIDEDGAIQEPR